MIKVDKNTTGTPLTCCICICIPTASVSCKCQRRQGSAEQASLGDLGDRAQHTVPTRSSAMSTLKYWKYELTEAPERCCNDNLVEGARGGLEGRWREGEENGRDAT